MRSRYFLLAFLLLIGVVGAQVSSAQATYTLTVVVEGVNEKDGNIGMLVFTSDKGWPDDRKAALRDIAVPAKPSAINTIEVPNLPAGEYAVAVIHDVNKNHKLDKNMLGVPTEQWGMSTNPSHGLKAPSFNSVKFSLSGNQEIHVKVQ
jgi:uncharacterized protein (DUF2141 family)